MLKVRARLSASGGLAQPGPLGEGPVVVVLPRHRQPCHELLLLFFFVFRSMAWLIISFFVMLVCDIVVVVDEYAIVYHDVVY